MILILSKHFPTQCLSLHVLWDTFHLRSNLIKSFTWVTNLDKLSPSLKTSGEEMWSESFLESLPWTFPALKSRKCIRRGGRRRRRERKKSGLFLWRDSSAVIKLFFFSPSLLPSEIRQIKWTPRNIINLSTFILPFSYFPSQLTEHHNHNDDAQKSYPRQRS